MLDYNIRRAFIFAPATPCIGLVVVLSGMDMRIAWLILLYSIPVSYGATFLVGIPIITIFKNANKSVFVAALIGACSGAIIFYFYSLFFAWLIDSSTDTMNTFIQCIWGAVLGLLVAIPFGIISRFPVWSKGKTNE
jgi:hypothetical protein